MSGEPNLEELRARIDVLSESVARLSGVIQTLRRELVANEKKVRKLEAKLERARNSGTGFFATFVETLGLAVKVLPVIAGSGGALVGIVAIIGAIQDCDAPPDPMRLEGQGTVMVATGQRAALLGERCDFFARQVGVGRCFFELRCQETVDAYAGAGRCFTDSYTRDTGEGGTTTDYYLRGDSDTDDIDDAFSFSEEEQLLELKEGDSRMTLVFHALDGRSILGTEGDWPEPGEE